MHDRTLLMTSDVGGKYMIKRQVIEKNRQHSGQYLSCVKYVCIMG
jgi:hypothetical protein